MTEATYSIDRDLSEAKALVEHLVPYIYENELYGSIGGMFASGSLPSLTIGALLMRLHRLHALQDRMTDAQKAQLAAVDAQLENTRKEWTIHYNEKLVQEANSRLKMIGRYFEDCTEDPRTCASNYPPEAMRRTIVQDIIDTLRRDGGLTPELERAAGKVDSQLHRFAQPSSFIWASALQPAYPKENYWWLYAQPPRATAG